MSELVNWWNNMQCIQGAMHLEFTRECVARLGGMALDVVPSLNFEKPVQHVQKPGFFSLENFCFYVAVLSLIVNFVVIRRK